MRYLLLILLIFILTSCDFKSSSDYNAEAEKLEKAGKYKDAISLLNIAIEKDPKNLYALTNRAVDKSIIEDYLGAIRDYSTIIKIDPDNALAYLNRGKNKKRLDDFKGAIDDFNRAIRTKGTDIIYIDKIENSIIDGFEFDVAMEEIRYERGIAYYNIDSLKTAFQDFDFCINKNFELGNSHLYRGHIFHAYRKNKEACLDYQNALKYGNEEAIKWIKEDCNE